MKYIKFLSTKNYLIFLHNLKRFSRTDRKHRIQTFHLKDCKYSSKEIIFILKSKVVRIEYNRQVGKKRISKSLQHNLIEKNFVYKITTIEISHFKFIHLN